MGICTREYFRSFVYQLWGHIFNIILTFRSALYKGENVSDSGSRGEHVHYGIVFEKICFVIEEK